MANDIVDVTQSLGVETELDNLRVPRRVTRDVGNRTESAGSLPAWPPRRGAHACPGPGRIRRRPHRCPDRLASAAGQVMVAEHDRGLAGPRRRLAGRRETHHRPRRRPGRHPPQALIHAGTGLRDRGRPASVSATPPEWSTRLMQNQPGGHPELPRRNSPPAGGAVMTARLVAPRAWDWIPQHLRCLYGRRCRRVERRARGEP